MRRLLPLFMLLSAAASLYGQGLDIVVHYNSLSEKQKADTLLVLANASKIESKFDRMFKYLEVAKPIVAKLNDPVTSVRYHTYKGTYLDHVENYSEVVNECKKALPFFDQVTKPENKRSSLFLIAKAHRHLKQYDSAHKYFDLTEKLNSFYNPYLNWYVYSEKGRMFQEVDNFKLAEFYFDKAYQLTKAKGIRMDHGVMLVYLLMYYGYSKEPEKYAKVMVEQIDFLSKRKNAVAAPSIHDVFYSDLQKMPLEEKVKFLTTVKTTLLKQGDITNAAYTNSAISKVYEKDNQFQVSLQYMRENLELTKAPTQLTNHYTYAKATYRLLTKAGMLKESAELFDYLFKLKDSISNQEQQAKLLELEAAYQAEKQKQEINILNSKNEFSLQQIKLLRTQNFADSVQLLMSLAQRKAFFKESLLKEFALKEQRKNYALLLDQNILQDSIVEGEKAYNDLLLQENFLKKVQLGKEQLLRAALARENSLNQGQLKREQYIKWGLVLGLALFLISGAAIFGLYKKQIQKNAIIQKQASDLEILMKEIHHRVKNNLQVVSSLLDLQSHSITDAQAHEAVKEGKNRVQSMALIHQNLYSEGNINSIRLKEYVNTLVQTLCDSYNITNDKVKINADIDDLNLDVETMIPLGLVLNELVSNAFKYAFKEKLNGVLNIFLKVQANQLHLVVSDNGVGFPAGLDVKTSKSFGLKMIRAFAQKLKAELNIYNNNGAVIKMKIAKFKMA